MDICAIHNLHVYLYHSVGLKLYHVPCPRGHQASVTIQGEGLDYAKAQTPLFVRLDCIKLCVIPRSTFNSISIVRCDTCHGPQHYCSAADDSCAQKGGVMIHRLLQAHSSPAPAVSQQQGAQATDSSIGPSKPHQLLRPPGCYVTASACVSVCLQLHKYVHSTPEAMMERRSQYAMCKR